MGITNYQDSFHVKFDSLNIIVFFCISNSQNFSWAKFSLLLNISSKYIQGVPKKIGFRRITFDN